MRTKILTFPQWEKTSTAVGQPSAGADTKKYKEGAKTCRLVFVECGVCLRRARNGFVKRTECLSLSNCVIIIIIIIVSSFVSVCQSELLSQLSRVSNISEISDFLLRYWLTTLSVAFLLLPVPPKHHYVSRFLIFNK
jgi:hypothetical protein